MNEDVGTVAEIDQARYDRHDLGTEAQYGEETLLATWGRLREESL